MRSLFVMDPPSSLHLEGDSTYVLMRECTDRGWDVAWCTPGDLYAEGGVAGARCVPTTVHAQAPAFRDLPPEDRGLDRFDVVWMRKDPPFDMDYIFATYLLDMAPPETLVVNDPHGLKLFNEKLWAMQFGELHPPTLLSSDARRIRAFVEAQPGRVVLKPWDGNGGRGVLVTDKDDRNLNSMIEVITDLGRRAAICQQYIEGIARGDKRILIFDGDPVGAILRVPSARDHRGNMHVGATVEATELSDEEQRICEILAPHLKKWGMTFVGIDVIDGYLTEINVTSPTGIQEVNRLEGVKLEADLVDRVHARLQAHRRKE